MPLYEVWIDGASRGSTGQAAIGVVVTRNQKTVWGFARGIGQATNNQSEYEALIAGLLMCWSSEDIVDPIIYSDSQLVVNQVNGIWRCEHPGLLPLLLSVRQIQLDYRFRLQKVPRAHVAAADRLANEFLDLLDKEFIELPNRPNIVELPPPPI